VSVYFSLVTIIEREQIYFEVTSKLVVVVLGGIFEKQLFCKMCCKTFHRWVRPFPVFIWAAENTSVPLSVFCYPVYYQ
jgi:hypothetical protein